MRQEDKKKKKKKKKPKHFNTSVPFLPVGMLVPVTDVLMVPAYLRKQTHVNFRPSSSWHKTLQKLPLHSEPDPKS
jgi:hypothetical protein